MKKYSKKVFHRRSGISLKTKLSLLKSEVIEALLYGSQTWTLAREHYDYMRSSHHHFLMRCTGFQKKERTDHVLAYHELLHRCQTESIETTIIRRRLRWAGQVARMSDSRLPKAMLFGELSDGKRRRGNPGKNWRHGLASMKD